MNNLLMLGLQSGTTYKCRSLDGFSGALPITVHTVILVIKIAVPILLILFGMIDLGKAVVASKEDEIKKGQQTFIKRLIAAIIVFFVITVVQIVVRFIAPSEDKSTITDCLNCFINGKEKQRATLTGQKASSGCEVSKNQ